MGNIQNVTPTGRDGGDRYAWLNNRVSTTVDDGVEHGMVLSFNDDGTASAADGGTIDAVAIDDAGASPYQNVEGTGDSLDTVQLRGGVEVRVTSDVTPGDRLVAANTGGATGETAGVATNGGTRQDPLVLTTAHELSDGEDVYFAVVHLG